MIGGPTRVFVLLAALFAIAHSWGEVQELACVDFYQFWAVGRAKQSMPIGNIYSDAERQRIGSAMLEQARTSALRAQETTAPKQLQIASYRSMLETYSTPWLYALFGVFSSGNYDGDQDRFQYFCLVCLLFAVLSIGLARGFSPTAILIASVCFLYSFAPVSSDSVVGNVNRPQLAALAAYLWLQNRSKLKSRNFWGGLVLGCAIAFKPNLGFVALTLCLGSAAVREYRRLRHQIEGIVAGTVISVLLAGWYFGSLSIWLNWSKSLSQLMNEYQADFSSGNFALTRFLADLPGAWMLPLIFVSAAVLPMIWCWKNRGRLIGDRLEFDLLLLSLGAILSVLVVPLAWLHYFVLTIPAILLLLGPENSSGRQRGSMVRRSLVIAATVMVALEPDKSVFHITEGVPASALMVSGGTLILFVLLLDRFRLLCAR